MQTDYLTEENLLTYLYRIFPNVEFIHDKAFPGYRFRPDYRSEEAKLVVEFDGYQHYTQAKNIIKDQEKDQIYRENHYKVVRIPYFVQLDTQTVEHLFGESIAIDSTYPHGFIANNSTLILPCDYCELGIQKFKADLEKFSYIKTDIVNSLKSKIGGSQIEKVLPPSLFYLVD